MTDIYVWRYCVSNKAIPNYAIRVKPSKFGGFMYQLPIAYNDICLSDFEKKSHNICKNYDNITNCSICLKPICYGDSYGVSWGFILCDDDFKFIKKSSKWTQLDWLKSYSLLTDQEYNEIMCDEIVDDSDLDDNVPQICTARRQYDII